MGKNINDIIKFYKQSENCKDLLFDSSFCYLLFKEFVHKYLYLRDKVNLDIINYLEKQENPKDITRIETTDFIDFIYNIQICISRNISDFPFPLFSTFSKYNEKSLDIIKNALNELNKKQKLGTYMELTEAENLMKEYNIKILHDDKMKDYDYDLDYPENRGFIKFEKQNLFATINDLNHINFIFYTKNLNDKIDIKTAMENMIILVNKFSAKIKFAFSQKYGFLTACPKYVGNGINISADIKINTLKNEFLDEYIKDKNMEYEELPEIKEDNEHRIIRLKNKGSFIESETEMFCNWIYYLNELIFKD